MSPTQQRVFCYLHKHPLVTPQMAFEDLGTMKLATVISELRREHGVEILKIPTLGVNRYGEPVRFMSYSLKHRNG